MDFDVPDAYSDRVRALEGPINDTIRRGLAVRHDYVPLDGVYDEPGLIRSKSVAPPPTRDCRIRIVALVGLDRQAFGGTHSGTTQASRPLPPPAKRLVGTGCVSMCRSCWSPLH